MNWLTKYFCIFRLIIIWELDFTSKVITSTGLIAWYRLFLDVWNFANHVQIVHDLNNYTHGIEERMLEMNLFGNLTSISRERSGVEWMSKFLRDTLPFLESASCKEREKLIVANHIYFQIANVLFLLSHFAPSGKCGVVYLKFMLLMGCVFFAIWGLEILCSLDILIWNLTFILCNLIHILILLVQMWPTRFTKEIEELYVELFRPLKVSRKQFKKLVKCIKSIRVLKYQEIYAQEKVTRIEFLSVVLSGKLVISQQNRALHIVYPHQFLDSSEWFSASTDEFFQVSITAVEDSRVLLWHRDKLKLSIGHDKFLKDILDHILSRDVVNKMIQVNEVVTASTNGHLPMIYDDDAFCDNKSLMIVKKTGDGSGITALLSKQLQGTVHRTLTGQHSNELVPLLNKGSYIQHNDQLSKLVLHTK